MIASPNSGVAVCRKPRIVAAPGKARPAIEDQARRFFPVGRPGVRFEHRSPHQIGRQHQHHRGLALATVHVEAIRLNVAAREIEWMDRAGIKLEIAGQLVHEVLQHPAVTAVTIDDDEIACRQRAHDFSPNVAQQGDKVLERERERAGRPIVLAREPERDARQLPHVEPVAPARDDAARERFGDNDVGVERQMRAVLLDRPERQAENRGLLQALGHLDKGELSQRADARAGQGSRELCGPSAAAPAAPRT